MRILQQHCVPSTFLDIMLAFGDKPNNGAVGSAQSAIHRAGASGLGMYSSNRNAFPKWCLTCNVQISNTFCHMSSSPRAVERKKSGTGQHGKSVSTTIT